MFERKRSRLWLIPIGLLAVLMWSAKKQSQKTGKEEENHLSSSITSPQNGPNIQSRPPRRERFFRQQNDIVYASLHWDDQGNPLPIHPRFQEAAPAVETTPFPRGINQERRYHTPTHRTVPSSLRSRPPVVMAGTPEDGRTALLPDEIDEGTLEGILMSFVPEAFDRIIAGETARLELPTPEGGIVDAEIRSIRDRGGMTQTFHGAVTGYREQASVVQMVYHDGIVHGSVALYDIGRHFEYRMLEDGHMMVRELDSTSRHQECKGPEVDPETELQQLSDELAAEGVELETLVSEAAEGGEVVEDTPGYTTVDIVVGYGQSARSSQGGTSQMEALIISSIDRMNTAFGNSLVTNVELVLLGSIEDPN